MNIEKWIEDYEISICGLPANERTVTLKISALHALFAGKVLVPVEPTDAMIDALFPGTGTHTCRELYKAMLAASQEPR